MIESSKGLLTHTHTEGSPSQDPCLRQRLLTVGNLDLCSTKPLSHSYAANVVSFSLTNFKVPCHREPREGHSEQNVDFSTYKVQTGKNNSHH